MNNDLISRSILKDKLMINFSRKPEAQAIYKHLIDIVDDCRTVEQPQGEWIFDEELRALTQTGEFMRIYHCSKCEFKIKTIKSYLPIHHKFCSVCGADMRGEENDNTKA